MTIFFYYSEHHNQKQQKSLNLGTYSQNIFSWGPFFVLLFE